MLFKLSLRNISRNLRDYAIYFLTLIIGVSIFYVFNALGTQTASMELTGELAHMMSLTSQALSGVSVFVALVLGLLIVYANRFLMKRRGREFALYMLLGMSKRDISGILLLETVFIGVGSLVAGLVLGAAASQLTSAFAAKLLDVDMSGFRFALSVDAVRKTVLYFAVMYIFVMLRSGRAVSKMKLIELFRSGRKSESMKLKNPKLCTLVSAMSAVVLALDYYLVTRLTLNASAGAVLTVCTVVGCIATLLIFWSLSGLLLRIFMSVKKVYFSELNSFTFRQISSKVNTTVFSMTIICLMLFFTICSLSGAFSIQNSINTNIKKQCLADFEIKHKEYSDDQFSVPAHGDVIEYYALCGIDLPSDFSAYQHFHSYIDPSFDIFTTIANQTDASPDSYNGLFFDGQMEIFRLSDYNGLMTLYGKKPLTLGERKFILLCNYENNREIYNKVMNRGMTATVFGQRLESQDKGAHEGFVDIELLNSNTGILIVPDSAVDEMYAASDYFIGNYRAETDSQRKAAEKKCRADHERVDAQLSEWQESGAMPNQFYMKLDTKQELIGSSLGLGAFVTFICLYLGMVFLIACGAVLALKELSDSVDSVGRYDILRKIGADERDISRSLLRQTGTFFLLPLAVACIHSIFGMKFAMKVITIFGTDSIARPVLSALLVVILIYGGYFLLTYFGGRRIVGGKN